jgi:hypothetical protein
MLNRRPRSVAALLVFAHCAAAMAQTIASSILGTVHESPLEHCSTGRFEVWSCSDFVRSTRIFSTASQIRIHVRGSSLRMRAIESRIPVQVQTPPIRHSAINSDYSKTTNLNSMDNRFVQSLDSLIVLAVLPQRTNSVFERTTRRQLSSV